MVICAAVFGGCAPGFNPDLSGLDGTDDGSTGGTGTDETGTDTGDTGDESTDDTGSETDTGSIDMGTDTEGGGTMLPGEACDPIDNAYDCIDGYACLAEQYNINVTEHVWEWTCTLFAKPVDDHYLEECSNTECDPTGICLNNISFPVGVCDTQNCCAAYCHLGDDCGAEMFCMAMQEGWPEGSHTIPANIGRCVAL